MQHVLLQSQHNNAVAVLIHSIGAVAMSVTAVYNARDAAHHMLCITVRYYA